MNTLITLANGCYTFDTKQVKDLERGTLIPFEDYNLPFKIKRVFILDNPKKTRGKHAHYQLEEILVPIVGSFLLTLEFKNEVTNNFMIPGSGVYITPTTWRTLSVFSDNCIVLSLCSLNNTEKDVIRDKNLWQNLFPNL